MHNNWPHGNDTRKGNGSQLIEGYEHLSVRKFNSLKTD